MALGQDDLCGWFLQCFQCSFLIYLKLAERASVPATRVGEHA